MDIEEVNFKYEVLELLADDEPGQNGVLVRYTPEYEDCSIIEAFVPVPFQKARDADHAKEIMIKKITSRAPAGRWRKELAIDESGDTETIGNQVASDMIGAVHESTNRTEGSAGAAAVSGEGGSQRGGSADHGDTAEQADDDPIGPGDARGARSGRRRR